MIALDTNVLVRFITRDEPTQTRRADRLLANGEAVFLISDPVLIELFWTLRRCYSFSPVEVQTVLNAFCERTDIEFEDRARVMSAISASAKGEDFADILIVEKARKIGCKTFVSFDRRLQKRFPDFVRTP